MGGGGRKEEAEEEAAGYRTKNKNPTQRCGEKAITKYSIESGKTGSEKTHAIFQNLPFAAACAGALSQKGPRRVETRSCS